MASRGLLPTVIDSVEQPVPTSKANEVGFLRLGESFFENGSRSIGGGVPERHHFRRGFAEQPGVLVRSSAGRSRVRIPREPPFLSERSAVWQRPRLGIGRSMVRIHPLRPV